MSQTSHKRRVEADIVLNLNNLVYEIIMRRTLIVIGILLILAVLPMGLYFQDAGCGACTPKLIPKVTLSFVYIPKFTRIKNTRFCQIAGCTPGTTFPFFVDIFGLGVVLLLVFKLKQT